MNLKQENWAQFSLTHGKLKKEDNLLDNFSTLTVIIIDSLQLLLQHFKKSILIHQVDGGKLTFLFSGHIRRPGRELRDSYDGPSQSWGPLTGCNRYMKLIVLL